MNFEGQLSLKHNSPFHFLSRVLPLNPHIFFFLLFSFFFFSSFIPLEMTVCALYLVGSFFEESGVPNFFVYICVKYAKI